MSKIEIHNRWSGAVMFECELSAEVAEQSYGLGLGFAVLKAYESGADLRDADLRGADMSGADLRGADMSRADMSRADLRGADLRDADMSGADLRGADMSRTDLRGADMSRADLRGADMGRADLRGADLRGADMSGADLRGADMSRADLRGADLTPIRDDLWAVLSAAPAEVEGLRKALIEGRVEGSTYHGECACLVGTIANIRHSSPDGLGPLKPNSSRPIERFFLAIHKGHTPDNSESARLVVSWIDEFLFRMRETFGQRSA